MRLNAVGFTIGFFKPGFEPIFKTFLTISASVFSLGRTTEAAHYIRKI
jgi:hypothetical protein